jgi:hypothetical protein
LELEDATRERERKKEKKINCVEKERRKTQDEKDQTPGSAL